MPDMAPNGIPDVSQNLNTVGNMFQSCVQRKLQQRCQLGASDSEIEHSHTTGFTNNSRAFFAKVIENGSNMAATTKPKWVPDAFRRLSKIDVKKRAPQNDQPCAQMDPPKKTSDFAYPPPDSKIDVKNGHLKMTNIVPKWFPNK